MKKISFIKTINLDSCQINIPVNEWNKLISKTKYPEEDKVLAKITITLLKYKRRRK
jgi:hypothetical protein